MTAQARAAGKAPSAPSAFHLQKAGRREEAGEWEKYHSPNRINSKCKLIWYVLTLRSLVTSILGFLCFISVCQKEWQSIKNYWSTSSACRETCWHLQENGGVGADGRVTSRVHDSTSWGNKESHITKNKGELRFCPGTVLTQGLR